MIIREYKKQQLKQNATGQVTPQGLRSPRDAFDESPSKDQFYATQYDQLGGWGSSGRRAISQLKPPQQLASIEKRKLVFDKMNRSRDGDEMYIDEKQISQLSG